MDFHEVADIFPLLVGDDYERFKADIASNGQLEPIWVYDSKIIDGRNRYRACVDLGIKPKYQQVEELKTSLVELVVSLNVNRRQLATGQLAACAVEALPPLEEEAKERQGMRTDLDIILPQEVSDLKKEIEKRLRIEYCPDPGDTWEWGYHINCPECGIEIYIGK